MKHRIALFGDRIARETFFRPEIVAKVLLGKRLSVVVEYRFSLQNAQRIGHARCAGLVVGETVFDVIGRQRHGLVLHHRLAVEPHFVFGGIKHNGIARIVEYGCIDEINLLGTIGKCYCVIYQQGVGSGDGIRNDGLRHGSCVSVDNTVRQTLLRLPCTRRKYLYYQHQREEKSKAWE